jgi:DNA-binding NarL/FixJ family response regulator
MTKIQDEPGLREKRSAAAKARREQSAALRQIVFDALAGGWSVEQIAALRKVSPRTVRREVDRALDERRLEAPERYARLQVARLTKALRLADASIDQGELRAIGPLVKVVAPH